MKYHALTLLIFLAALLVYAAGFAGPFVVLLLVGGALEVWFWARVLRARRARRVSASP